jgi:hypothetical protein
MEERHHSPKDDPLGFTAADREMRIHQLKQQLKKISKGKVVFGPSACEPQLEEAFLAHVLAFESEQGVRPVDVLKRDGFDLKAPKELTDEALSRHLWRLIRALAEYRVFIERTDHLSNRELYSWLWNKVLRE